MCQYVLGEGLGMRFERTNRHGVVEILQAKPQKGQTRCTPQGPFVQGRVVLNIPGGADC